MTSDTPTANEFLLRIAHLFPKIVRQKGKYVINKCRAFGKQKIFGIGLNKTGTTSLTRAMIDLGFLVGREISEIEILRDWSRRDFKSLKHYCETAQFFQDVPFSLPHTFIVLDQLFPGSKFILTHRGSPEEWHASLVNFETKLWGKNGRPPSKEDLQKEAKYFAGYRWEVNRLIYETPENDLYNKEMLMKHYKDYNDSVNNYFRFRPKDLLTINVSEPDSYHRLCAFLNVKPKYATFPWENKTANISKKA